MVSIERLVEGKGKKVLFAHLSIGSQFKFYGHLYEKIAYGLAYCKNKKKVMDFGVGELTHNLQFQIAKRPTFSRYSTVLSFE